MSDQKFPRSLPAASNDVPAQNLPVSADTYWASAQSIEPQPEEPPVPISQYLWVLKPHRWKIVSFTLACVLATLIISKRLTPIYESTATVDIDRQTPAGIIGDSAMQISMNDADEYLATQIKLIQSDSVLRPVAQQLHLPDSEFETVKKLPPGITAADAPVVLKHLKVTRPANTYLLQLAYRSEDPKLAADVANAVAHSYLQHTYEIRFRSSASLGAFMEKQLEELKAKMERSSQALAQFEKELNVINPEEKTSILSARLLQLNTEYTNAQGDRVTKEAAYRSVKDGGMEAAQTSNQGESLKKLLERLDEVQQQFADVKIQYGPNHPEYRKAAAQLTEIERQVQVSRANIVQRVQVEYNQALAREAALEKAVAETKAEFDRLNARSFEYQSLKDEADADKKLYEELVRKIKEAGINAGFQNSAVRIADTARPAVKPVFPKTLLNVVLAGFFSLMLSIGGALVSDALNNTVRDPEQINRMNTEVVASLPAIKEWRSRAQALTSGNSNVAVIPGASQGGTTFSSYDEAIRTLRNSIFLSDFNRRVRTMMVSSPSPSEGKTTVSSHLAIAHAQQGRKTLIIDADLRRPSLHRRLDVTALRGLTDVLGSGLDWREMLVHHGSVPNLDILPAGPASRRVADLLGVGLPPILNEAAEEYDLVILDSPPLLGFPEPLELACLVDGVLMVALAGSTNRKALRTAVSTLNRLRVNLIGVALNEVKADGTSGYYYHYYSAKYYRHYEASASNF